MDTIKNLLIGFVTILAILTLIYFLRIKRDLKLKRGAADTCQRETEEIDEKRKILLSYPIFRMRKGDFDLLPPSTIIQKETCELDTKFRFEPAKGLEDFLIIGEVVDACDALESQYDECATSIPTRPGSGKRFINRYRVVLV